MPDDAAIKKEFDRLRQKDPTAAIKYLADAYRLEHRDSCELACEDTGESASHHAKTNGGRGEKSETITVKVNKAYFDRQVKDDEGYVKLIHTLGHELQHAGQRGHEGWRDKSTKPEREFLAYSWEVTVADDLGIPGLKEKAREKTIESLKSEFNEMDDAAKARVADRVKALKAKGIELP